MAISPFMAGVSGFMKRRREVKDAQKLQQHELNKITTTANENARIANAALPKFYVPGADGTRNIVKFSDGTDMHNNIKDGSTSLGEADAYATMVHQGWKDNHTKWSQEQKDAYMVYMHGAKDNLNTYVDETGKDGNIVYRESNNDIYQFNFPEQPVEGNKITLNGTANGGGDDGQPVIPIRYELDDRETKAYPAAFEYAKEIIKTHSNFKPDPKYNGDYKSIAEAVIDRYSVHSLAFASTLPNLKYEVKGGNISEQSFSAILGKANELYGNPDEIRYNHSQHQERNKFVYDVIRSSANDTHSIKTRSITDMNPSPKAYAETVELDREDAKAKYDAAKMGRISLAQLNNAMKTWQSTQGDKNPPIGIFGRLLGSTANAVLSQVPGAVTAFISDIKNKNGITVITGQVELEKRLKKYGSESYITSVGRFRAEYDVWTEILAYQLASTLQGGTGGKTISDQDVLNIKRALGESLFQNGEFQMHRYKQLENFMDTIKGVNEKLSKAKTVGDIDAAVAYSDYIFDFHARKTFGFMGGDRNKDYNPGELSESANSMLRDTFRYADDVAKIPENRRVLNGAALSAEGKNPEDYHVVEGQVVLKKILKGNALKIANLEKEIDLFIANAPPEKGGTYQEKLAELKADLDEAKGEGELN